MRDNDAVARSSTVLEAEKPAGLNRRQLLRAGAWAAPALVLATAAPAAAASTPPVPTAPAYRAAAAVATTPVLISWLPRTITVYNCTIEYDYGAWSLPRELASGGPSIAMFTYNLDLINEAGAAIRKIATNTAVTVAKDQKAYLAPRYTGLTLTGLPAGTYRVRLTVSSATFTGQTANATFAATLPVVTTSARVTVL